MQPRKRGGGERRRNSFFSSTRLPTKKFFFGAIKLFFAHIIAINATAKTSKVFPSGNSFSPHPSGNRDEMRNSFNLLLIALICFDSWYLFGSILEAFRRTFGLSTDLHTWYASKHHLRTTFKSSFNLNAQSFLRSHCSLLHFPPSCFATGYSLTCCTPPRASP